MVNIYTNSEEIEKMFPSVEFEYIRDVRESLMKEEENIEFSSVLTGYNRDIWDRVVFVEKSDDDIVGLLSLAYSDEGFQYNKDHKYACTFVSVHNEHKGRGIGTRLIQAMFDFAERNGIDKIKQSRYEVDFIKKTFNRIASNHKSVELIEAPSIF